MFLLTFDLLPVSTTAGATYRPSHDAPCFVIHPSGRSLRQRDSSFHNQATSSNPVVLRGANKSENPSGP